VEETFETIGRIYRATGAPDRCRLVIGEGGHRFYADHVPFGRFEPLDQVARFRPGNSPAMASSQ
jgi:hypothetical protein